jgi:hypothetical protein
MSRDEDLPHYLKRPLDDRHREMSPVVDETGNVVLRHLWKLLLEDAFQPSEDDKAVASIVVVHNSEFYFSGTLFDDCRLNMTTS